MATVSTTATDPTAENNTATAGTTVGCATNPIVTTSADTGPGSLRRAIQDACDVDTITFDRTQVVSPIALTSGELTISKNLTIQGPGANVLTVKRNVAGRFRIFTISSGVTVNISGLTITNGFTADGLGIGISGGFGGGISNSGTLMLTGVAVSGNQTGKGGDGVGFAGGSGGAGGGINNVGTLTIIKSTISGNQTGNGGNGVGSFNGAGGFGGGIFSNGTLTITNSTISGNQTGAAGSSGVGASGGFGGGILNGGTLTISNSTITGNTAGTGGLGGGIRRAACTGTPT